MELAEERAIDEAPAQPPHCVGRKLAPARTHCLVALFLRC
jgi:hypothetical protein